MNAQLQSVFFLSLSQSLLKFFYHPPPLSLSRSFFLVENRCARPSRAVACVIFLSTEITHQHTQNVLMYREFLRQCVRLSLRGRRRVEKISSDPLLLRERLTYSVVKNMQVRGKAFPITLFFRYRGQFAQYPNQGKLALQEKNESQE